MTSEKDGIPLLNPGEVFEKYTVEKLLGRGGMGAVYLVRHNVLDSLFALKVLFPEAAERNRQFVDRFIREAKLACKIRHPNLIAVHDAGRNPENGMYYIVMDYVPGGSVRELLKKEFRLPPARALEIVTQIAGALSAAHRHHMVHRDIKPDNIMFAADGTAKLADLGIAKSTDEQDTMLTMASSVFGTPAYMSPEQALDSGKVDSRADIYSLGVVFYEMLCGRQPFRGESTMQILSQVVAEKEIPDVRTVAPHLPPQLAELVAAMTAKKLADRIPDPETLLKRLSEIRISGSPPPPAGTLPPEAPTDDATTVVMDDAATVVMAKDAPAPAPMKTTPPPRKGRGAAKIVWAILAAVILVGIAGAAGYFYFAGKKGGAAAAEKKNAQDAAATEKPKPVEKPVVIAEIPKPSEKPEEITEKPKPVEKPAPVVEKPKPVEKPAPVAEKPKPVEKPAPVAEKPKPVEKTVVVAEKPKVETPAPVVEKPKPVEKTVVVAEKPKVATPAPAPVVGKPKPVEKPAVVTPAPVSVTEIETVTKTEPPAPPPEEEEIGSDPLGKGKIVLLAGASDRAKDAKRSLIGSFGSGDVSWQRAESMGGYRRQIEEIVKSSPAVVIVDVADKYAGDGISKSSFENLIRNLANALHDGGVPFVFVLSPDDGGNRRLRFFNEAVEELCKLKSIPSVSGGAEGEKPLADLVREIRGR